VFLVFGGRVLCYNFIMRIVAVEIPRDLLEIERVARVAFSATTDSSLSEWFSFPYMEKMISESRGLCLKAVGEDGNVAGIMYAQQESPINGKEGEEKWVVIIAGVDPKYAGQGVGSLLLKVLEAQARSKGAKKMFVFTNKNDDKVISFYHKNGYEDAGSVKDYQYGSENSAVFLLKYLT